MADLHRPPACLAGHDSRSPGGMMMAGSIAPLVERLVRVSVDLLVPSSLATTTVFSSPSESCNVSTSSSASASASASSSTSSSSSTISTKRTITTTTTDYLDSRTESTGGGQRHTRVTEKESVDTTSSSTITTASFSSGRASWSVVEDGKVEETRFKWFFVLLTFVFFFCFQLSCFYIVSSSSPAFPSALLSSSSSSLSSSSLMYSNSPFLASWAGTSALASVILELAVVAALYTTRDLPLAAACLAGCGNLFVASVSLLCGIQSEALVWLLHGPMIVFLVFGRRPGLYATIAVILESLIIYLFLLLSTPVPATLLLGPLGKVATNIAVLATIGAVAYAGECTQAFTFGGLLSALAQCEEAHAKLRQACETNQNFLANISHELRTPLHGITATALELLETLPSEEAAAREGCQLIAECGRLMRSLIEDILDFEQMESNRLLLDKLPFNVAGEVERATNLLSTAADKKRLEIDTSAVKLAFPTHVGDPLRFRQIIFNLLSNAIKFTPEGGKITVSTINTEDNPEEIKVEVTDTGIGIEADSIPHLFTSFFQEDSSTRRCNGGTGLGLAICKSLCEAMGGQISCHSQVGGGSTFEFTVFLPVASSQSETSSTQEVSSAVVPTSPKPPVLSTLGVRGSSTGSLLSLRSSTFIPSPLILPSEKSPLMESSLHGVHVLLVEDNLVNQKVGVRMLNSLGCSVIVANNGDECMKALEREEAEGREFDAVLMDCQMPVMDGFQATASIRERERARDQAHEIECQTIPTEGDCTSEAKQSKRLPVIALTASATKEYRERCFVSGMDDWLAKPFTKANLSRILRKWTRPTAQEPDQAMSRVTTS